jgi:hypothetical protein
VQWDSLLDLLSTFNLIGFTYLTFNSSNKDSSHTAWHVAYAAATWTRQGYYVLFLRWPWDRLLAS